MRQKIKRLKGNSKDPSKNITIENNDTESDFEEEDTQQVYSLPPKKRKLSRMLMDRSQTTNLNLQVKLTVDLEARVEKLEKFISSRYSSFLASGNEK